MSTHKEWETQDIDFITTNEVLSLKRIVITKSNMATLEETNSIFQNN